MTSAYKTLIRPSPIMGKKEWFNGDAAEPARTIPDKNCQTEEPSQVARN